MVLLSNRFDTSHCEYRLTASFDRSHPSSHILLCLHCYVPLHLLTQALIITDAEAEIPQTHEEPVQDSHVKSSAVTSKKNNDRRCLFPIALLRLEQFFTGASEPVETGTPVVL